MRQNNHKDMQNNYKTILIANLSGVFHSFTCLCPGDHGLIILYLNQHAQVAAVPRARARTHAPTSVHPSQGVLGSH